MQFVCKVIDLRVWFWKIVYSLVNLDLPGQSMFCTFVVCILDLWANQNICQSTHYCQCAGQNVRRAWKKLHTLVRQVHVFKSNTHVVAAKNTCNLLRSSTYVPFTQKSFLCASVTLCWKFTGENVWRGPKTFCIYCVNNYLNQVLLTTKYLWFAQMFGRNPFYWKIP